jgi:fructokinase
MTLYGGIEAGGTKFVCIISSGPGDIRAETRFSTTTPAETIGHAIAFFKDQAAACPISALGVASFGPVDLNPSSPTFGFITKTPKSGWSQVDFVGQLKASLHLPVAMDTDVNAAALSEHLWGASIGIDPSLYFTIGTGVGGGVLVNGTPVHGLVHPEAGHLRIPHNWQDDPFPGACPFHGDCFEGLASGTAIRQRWGHSAETLPPGHPAWELEANYIALAMVNVIVLLSPGRIILGGGVMHQQDLFPLVHKKISQLLNSYVQSPAIIDEMDSYIVPPKLGNLAGVLGAVALAKQCLEAEAG